MLRQVLPRKGEMWLLLASKCMHCRERCTILEGYKRHACSLPSMCTSQGDDCSFTFNKVVDDTC